MSEYDKFFSRAKDKSFAVLGCGVSNAPLVDKLISAGAQIVVCDRRIPQDIGPEAETFLSKGVEFSSGADYLAPLETDIFDYIVRSPGIRPDLPPIEHAVKRGAELTSEMELFFRLCPANIIGITGSDGKTTTTTIISLLLEKEGYNVFLGGNIGTPLLTKIPQMSEGDFAVVELSSFQLMTMCQSPSRAVITNITPNHLDIHKSMQEYAEAKYRIFQNQGEKGLLVLNEDCLETAKLAELCRGDLRMFSKVDASAFAHIENGFIVADGKPLLAISDIKIPGMHNVENYMAAISVVYDLISADTIKAIAMSFGGVEHRAEFVIKAGGVSYYNDSIASSPTRTAATLNAFTDKVVLIAGGYDKHLDYAPLAPSILKKAKKLILTGQTAEKIRVAVADELEKSGGELDMVLEPEFENAVLAARSMAEEGDIVLLSPASASFDQFKNFMERGNTFKKIVNNFSAQE